MIGCLCFLRRLLAGFLVLMLIAPYAALSQSFFQSIEDLPLAPGLTEAVNEGISFDSPQGRIATALARGAGDWEGYRRFYETALPALGWERRAPGIYRRDGEVLRLEFRSRGSRVEVQIRVVPQGTEKDR